MTEQDHEHEEEGYTGPAALVVDEAEVPVRAVLRGYFQPIDGRYHWYGRLDADEAVTKLVEGGRRELVLRTPGGEATATLSDPDPWQRYRVTGTSRPPFEVDAVPAAD
ncbi:DUF4873 domain-containing protein [Kutzneria viridogrisea]|uniref:DUF4873 domain-containing protein n=2 Tax=Kutzneria TaxID=43356 RepID=W5VZM4_9PSEU|nr:DUF4873 domain-containing protein [Kutzneria albida]AHH94373.1 hypothetical protein KALB_1000 [Kutzneria albida DSM 43870]MBA8930039.1 hypothetical protein [Kutzneria viridogrisea]